MSSDAKPPDLVTPAPNDVPLAVQLTGITKRFPGVVANSDINISVRRGSVHALVGENGAVKSTLLRILSGDYLPDAGSIRLDGQPVAFYSPLSARRSGRVSGTRR